MAPPVLENDTMRNTSSSTPSASGVAVRTKAKCWGLLALEVGGIPEPAAVLVSRVGRSSVSNGKGILTRTNSPARNIEAPASIETAGPRIGVEVIIVELECLLCINSHDFFIEEPFQQDQDPRSQEPSGSLRTLLYYMAHIHRGVQNTIQ